MKINLIQLDLVGKNNSKMKIRKVFFDIFDNVQPIEKFRVRNLLNKVEEKVHRRKKLIKEKLLEIMYIQRQFFLF